MPDRPPSVKANCAAWQMAGQADQTVRAKRPRVQPPDMPVRRIRM
jgi:hypothetical protein